MWGSVFSSPSYAKSALEKAIQLNKEAEVFLNKHDYSKAIEKYNQALEFFKHPDLFIRLGQAYLLDEQGKPAQDNCQLALSYQDELTTALEEKAKKCIEESIKLLNIIQADVYTRPKGAKLRIDGQYLGQTPWKGTIEPGRRQFDITLDGYRSVSRTLMAQAGQRVRLSFILIPEGLGGLFSLYTNPEGANVMIDQTFVGTSPILAFPLSKGLHTYQVIQAGFIPETRQVYIEEGQNIEQNLSLSPQRGRLSATDLWPAWTLMGIGVASGILGGIFGYQALNAYQNADTLARFDGTPEKYVEYRDNVRDLETFSSFADGMWITSGLLITSGLTWWLVSR